MSAAVAPRPQLPAVAPPSDLVLAPLAALTLPSAPAVDVYASTPGALPKLLWDRDARLGDDHVAEIRRSGERYSFWIAKRDFPRVVDVVHAAWHEIAGHRKLPPCERFALCALMHAMELQATIRLVKCGPHIESAKRVAAFAAVLLTEQSYTTRELVDAVQLTSSAPFRGTSLAAYALRLAQLSGIADPVELEQIAVGALLHDVGARRLPIDPATHPERWSAEEREQVERHPQASYEELLGHELTHGQLMMAYQHHEHLDGSGYPVGLVGDEIHLWARLLAVVERFETLTTPRAYRRALDLPDALARLGAAAGAHLDAELTQCWINSLASS
jgi:hypothetical protein